MNVIRLSALAGCLICATASLILSQTSQPGATPTVQPATVKDGVRSISMPNIATPDLAEGPGRDTYAVSCALCHTQRYVTMQPRFSRKVWTDEVNKMINTYKAQIPPDQVPHIVDYLVSVRGTGT